MRLDIGLLREIVNTTFQKYIDDNGIYIDTEVDYFWNIDMIQAVNFKQLPQSLKVESLDDDYEELMSIIKSKRNVNIIDFDRLANVFKVISYEIENQPDKII